MAKSVKQYQEEERTRCKEKLDAIQVVINEKALSLQNNIDELLENIEETQAELAALRAEHTSVRSAIEDAADYEGADFSSFDLPLIKQIRLLNSTKKKEIPAKWGNKNADGSYDVQGQKVIVDAAGKFSIAPGGGSRKGRRRQKRNKSRRR